MDFEKCDYLKEFCTNIPLIILPSTLWNIHVDPQYRYVAIVHIQVQSFSKLIIDKGILLTNSSTLIKTSFFIQNDLIHIPKLTNCIATVSDLSRLIQIVHELKICPNVEQVNCNKYVEFNKYNEFCTLCTDELNLQLACVNSSSDDLEKDETFSPENEIDAVIYEKPKTENNFTCDVCSKCFTEETHLLQHLPSHSKENPYVCEICNKISSRRSIHEKHLQTHSHEKPHLCNVCGKTFCQSYRMKDHLITHSMERPFECQICQKVFAKSYNLKLHQKTHSGVRPYVCSICGKTYTTQSNLTTHVRSVHTKEKPHACSKCDMTFVHPRNLRLHMLKHTGEKPYSCMICDKSFAKKIHLTIHLRIHTGEKPHLCTICGKGFTTTGNLSAHKRTHHKDVHMLNT